MDEVWTRGEATVRDVLTSLNARDKERAYTTIMTIMARLDEKGLLTRKRVGKGDVYRPRISREDYGDARARARVEGLVADYGDLALAHFARELDGLDDERRRKLRDLAEGSSG